MNPKEQRRTPMEQKKRATASLSSYFFSDALTFEQNYSVCDILRQCTRETKDEQRFFSKKKKI